LLSQVDLGELNIEGFVADNTTIYDHIVNNQNSTQNALIFTSAYLNNGKEPNNIGYLLFYNSSYSNNHGYYSPAIQVMKSIDEVILQMKTKNPNAKIEINAANYPRTAMREAGFDIVAANGAVWFYVPPMVTFFVLLTELVLEKEQKLRVE